VSSKSVFLSSRYLVAFAAAFSIVSHAQQPDNSKVNERDASQDELTAEDQGNSKHDTGLTQQIRQQVVKHPSFSTDAKNIKIISVNGIVTLKGPVETQKEKNEIETIAAKVAGASHVMSQIEVKTE